MRSLENNLSNPPSPLLKKGACAACYKGQMAGCRPFGCISATYNLIQNCSKFPVQGSTAKLQRPRQKRSGPLRRTAIFARKDLYSSLPAQGFSVEISFLLCFFLHQIMLYLFFDDLVCRLLLEKNRN